MRLIRSVNLLLTTLLNKNPTIIHFVGLAHSMDPLLTAPAEYFASRCPLCADEQQTAAITIDELEPKAKEICATLLSQKGSVLFRPSILTDCCILYCAIIRLHPKTVA